MLSIAPVVTHRWLVLATALAIAGCSSPKPHGVYSSHTERLTFNDDGTAIFEGSGGPVSATWRMVDDDRFLLTVTGFGSISTFGCKAKDGIKLRMPPPDARVVRFQAGTYDASPVTTGTSLGLGLGEREDCIP